MVFDTPGGSTTATMSLPALVVSGISVVSGDTTFDLGGGTYAGDAGTVGSGGGAAGVLVLDGTLGMSSFAIGNGVGSDVDLIISNGGGVTTTGALTAMSDATVLIDGGTLTTASLSLANAVDFQSGAIVVNGDLTWADLGTPGPIVLDATRTLTVGQAFTGGAAGTLTLDGGALSVGSFAAGSSLDYQSGDLTVATGSIGVGGAHVIAGSASLGTGDQWDIGDTLHTVVGFSLTVDGGAVMADGLTNAGTYTQNSGSTTANVFLNTASGSFNLAGGSMTVGQVAGNQGTFNLSGPATFRLTGENLMIDAGGDFGDQFTVAQGGTLRVDMNTQVGASGPGTLTLDAGATLITSALVVGDGTAIDRNPTAVIRANQISNLGTIGLDTVAGWDVLPWTSSSIALINSGTLTHNTSAVTTLSARVVGTGAVAVHAGTVVLDNRDAAFDWTTSNDFDIAIDAELAFQSVFGPVGNFSDLTLASPAAITNNGTLRLVDQHLGLRGDYTGTGRLVMEQDARVTLDPANGPVTIHDLSAGGGPTFRRYGGGMVDLTVLRSDGMNVDFGVGIDVTFVEDVTLTGGTFNEAITNSGVLRLAEGAQVVRQPDGQGDEGLAHNMAGASILLGDDSEFRPYGELQNDGLISLSGADIALLEPRELEGTGVVSSGDGTLDLLVSDLDNWAGTFAGNAGSTLNVTYRGAGPLAGPASIDTDGGLFLWLVETLALDDTLRVGGLLTINRTPNFELDLSTATVELHDVRMIDVDTWQIHSAPTLVLDSLTIHDNAAGDPGHLTINYDGELTIGAGGIVAGTGVTLDGGGTVRVLGASVPRYYEVRDNGTLEVGAGLAPDVVNDVQLHGNTHLINHAGSTIESLFLVSRGSGERFTNHGTVTTTLIDETVDWSNISSVVNHGTIVFSVDERFILPDGFENHGTLSVEAGADLRFLDMSQSATGSLAVQNAAVLFTNSSGGANVLNGSIDFTGADVTIGGTVLIEAGTVVASLGTIISSGDSTLTSFTGQTLDVEDVFLPTRLNTASNLTDAFRVHGTISSGHGGRLSIPAFIAGTVAPGDSVVGDYAVLRFDRDLVFETGSRLEMGFIDGPLHDRLWTGRDLIIEPGVTLDLDTLMLSATSLDLGAVLQLIFADAPMTGAFDVVSGLDLGDGRRFTLNYETAGLLLEVHLAGDVDGDGFVGAVDLDVLLAEWGDRVAAGTGADLTGDGLVGQSDLDIVTSHWGQGTPPSPNVPEPGSLAVLLAGGVLLQRRRRNLRHA
ncbi:MAG: PEP-CTERM sorting domain-containing protein [Planctomycetota bacterium]